MQHPSTPASIAPVHSAGAPGSARSFLLGCGLAFVWLVLLILQILAEPRLDILQTAENLGLSAGWCELLLGSLLFALLLGLTLRLLPRFRKARPLAWLLAGWVGGGATLCLLFVIWFYKYGAIGAGGRRLSRVHAIRLDGRNLRVISGADKVTVHNAFPDRRLDI